MPRFKTILLLAALLALFAACGDNAPPPSDEPAGGNGDFIVIEGEALGLAEITFLLTNAIDEFALFYDLTPGGIDFGGYAGGVPVRRHLLERALEMATEAYVTGIKAVELGFSLTEEEEIDIDWEIAMEIDFWGGREAFLESVGDEDVYRFYTYTIPVLREKMLESLFGPGGPYEPDNTALWFYFKDNYTSAAYIFLSGTDTFGEPLDDDEWTVMQSVANALWRQAVEADGKEGFLELMREHDQSYYMMVYPEGMAVPRGLLGELFDEALRALPVGGISNVVVTEDGFYIILRLADDLSWFEEHKEEIWYFSAQELFAGKLEEWGRGLEILVIDAFWELDPLEIAAQG